MFDPPPIDVSLPSNGLYGSADTFERDRGMRVLDLLLFVLDLLLLVENTVTNPRNRGR